MYLSHDSSHKLSNPSHTLPDRFPTVSYSQPHVSSIAPRHMRTKTQDAQADPRKEIPQNSSPSSMTQPLVSSFHSAILRNLSPCGLCRSRTKEMTRERRSRQKKKRKEMSHSLAVHDFFSQPVLHRSHCRHSGVRQERDGQKQKMQKRSDWSSGTGYHKSAHPGRCKTTATIPFFSSAARHIPSSFHQRNPDLGYDRSGHGPP